MSVSWQQVPTKAFVPVCNKSRHTSFALKITGNLVEVRIDSNLKGHVQNIWPIKISRAFSR
jgi:hypothetical protein